KMKMDLGVDVLPKFSKDTTDRNRTSPFAFTGNKFEFRMPGSAENLSDCNTILNTAVAKELKQFVAETEDAADFECAAAAWVKKTLNAHRRVIFNGNGYSEAWEQEAERRGLPNRKCTPDAMVALKDEKNIALMEEFGVLTKTEMLSRYEVEMEHYSKVINIEARTMLKIANKQLIPAATSYMGEVAGSAAAKMSAVEGISTHAEQQLLVELTKHTDEMSDAAVALKEITDRVCAMEDETAKAHAFHDEVLPAMARLRAAADLAEEIVDEEYWPLPCYSRILFYTE
ncbi:MAG: glutamine synthetase type III, partial [Gemmiger sp.]|nr:glutamine synthetase type III [Gemmiger sp.]